MLKSIPPQILKTSFLLVILSLLMLGAGFQAGILYVKDTYRRPIIIETKCNE